MILDSDAEVATLLRRGEEEFDNTSGVRLAEFGGICVSTCCAGPCAPAIMFVTMGWPGGPPICRTVDLPTGLPMCYNKKNPPLVGSNFAHR